MAFGFLLSASFWLLLLAARSRAEAPLLEDANKALKICSVAGGLDIARLASSNTRNLFRDALEDVELIREYISEAAYNGGIVSGLHDLDELDNTLDWRARNMTASDASTVSAGLGYSDDRESRRVERYVGLVNEPYVGTKTSDLALIDSASNIFPWIVDRRSVEGKWYLSHQNGRSDVINARFDQLYVAAWIGTRGEAWMYYPPLSRTFGHPFCFGDVLGSVYDSREEEFVKPNLPENNPARLPHFTPPYADTAMPGLSLITAQAPVYFTGVFQGHQYNNTYIASTGVDISVASMSTLLDELQDTLTEGSFAFLVSAQDFRIIVISQSTVEKVYPRRTGFEEGRVTYDTANGSVLNDRRNQTYQVSDTIFQSPKDLKNANWTDLALLIKSLSPGERSSSLMNITLTGENQPTPFHVMYERWADVADWALVVFAPQILVDTAVSVRVDKQVIELELLEGTTMEAESIITNNGTLDVTIRITKLPPWFTLREGKESGNTYKLPAGRSLTLRYKADAEGLAGTATSLIAFTVADDGYTDCFFEQVMTVEVVTKVIYEEELNQLDRIRPYGFTLAAIIAASTVGCSIWVFVNSSHRVVRASQPVFLQMICAGILLMGLSIIPMGIDDSLVSEHGCNVACMSVPWLLALGFSVTYSALFSKIWRINQIVSACKNYRRVHVSVRHVMIPFFVICTLNLTLLSLWTGVDPLIWIREPKSESTHNHFSSVGYCGHEGSSASMAFFVLLLMTNFVALILALIQLYRARGLADEYSEGKYIAIAVGSMVQVFLTGVPTLVIVTDSPQASFFVKSSIVFVMSMSSLLLMFVPKFFITAQEKQDRRSSNSGEFIRNRRSKQTMNNIHRPNEGIEQAPRSSSLKPNQAPIGHTFAELVDRYSPELPDVGMSAELSSAQPAFRESNGESSCARKALPSISDISMSYGGSEFDRPLHCEAPFSDAFASCENATPPTRTATIFEESDNDVSNNEDMRSKTQCTNDALTTPAPSLAEEIPRSSSSSKSDGVFPGRAPSLAEDTTHLSRPVCTSVYSNASLPMRTPSLVEEISQSPLVTRTEHCNAIVATREPLHAEARYHSPSGASSAQLNAVMPIRAPSIVEEITQHPASHKQEQVNATMPVRAPSIVEPTS